jgi:phosphoserine phosphatase
MSAAALPPADRPGAGHAANGPAMPGAPTPTTARPVDRVRALWREARAVCFDVDSTVCMDEGIDILAAVAGKGTAIAALTAAAMNGGMTFQESLARRLDILQPGRDLVARTLDQHPPRLSPGIRDLMARLRGRGCATYLVSGGFRQMIEPILPDLGLERTQLFANELHFSADGAYAGFNRSAPTAESGGKAAVVASLRARPGHAPIIMVGDGATDLEARPPADAFIGYGGVVVRPRVRDQADWFVTSFADLITALDG